MKRIITILGLTLTMIITSVWGNDISKDTNTSLCYDKPIVKGFNIMGFGIFYGVTTPIRNTSSTNLTDVNITKTFDGINMSMLSKIAIDDNPKTVERDTDEAEKNSDISGSFKEFNVGLFNQGIDYRISEFNENQTHTIYDYSMFSFNMSKIKIGAEYTKNGQRYYAVLHPCDDGGGSSSSTYPVGPFNIIEPTTSINDNTDPIDESNSKNYIYTKVISQDFNISLIHLADDNITLTNVYAKDTNVSIDIIDTANSDAVIKEDIWDKYFNQGVHSKRIEISNLNIDRIVREARFRINITTTKKFCIKDCTTKTIAYSRDTFSIRPYALVAFGQNQYKRAGEDFNITIKAVDKENFNKVGNSSYSGRQQSNVTGVATYNAKLADFIIASNFYQPTNSEINQMQTDIGSENNATINGKVNNCPEIGNFIINNSNTSFTNGKVNASLNFSETGILNLFISETPGSEWAKIDEKDTNDSLRYIRPSTVTYDENNISANTLQLFVPYEFNTTAEYNTTNAKNWLYMYDINKSNSTFITPKMSAFVKYKITALNKDGAVVKNYTRECFPDVDEVHAPRVNGLKLNTTFDLFLDMDLNTTQDTNISLYSENNTSNAIWSLNKNASLLATNANQIQEWISPFQFENGVGEAKVYFNIDRNVSVARNPISIKVIDANTSTSWMANIGSPAKFNGITLDQKKVFLYGRAHAMRERYTGSDGNVSIYYEVYCNLSNGGNKSLIPDGVNSKYTDDPRWFINTKHDTTKDGKVNSIKQRNFALVQVTSINTQTPTTAQLEYNEAEGYPYKTTMEINASNWLIYNKYNKDAKKNEFEVEFINNSSSWAGEHETNSTTRRNAADKTNRRLMW